MNGLISRGRFTIVSVVCLVVAWVCTGLADGFRNPPEGAANLGRGGARLAYGDDPSAISHNPASIMDLKQKMITPTATIGYSRKEYTAPNGMSEKSESPWVVLPALYAAWPVQDGMVAGIGVNVPYGQSSEWNENGILKFRAPYFAQMKSVNVNPTLALRAGENVLVGAGVDLMWSSLEFRQSFPWTPPPAGFMGPSGRLAFEGDGYAFGGNAGLTWEFTKNQRLALSYRSPMSVDYEGDFSMQSFPPALTAPPSDFKTTVDFPSVAGVGYGIRATDTLRLQADVEWVEHSRNKSMDLDIGANNVLLMQAMGTTALPQDWKDTWTFGAGADWTFQPGRVLRAGWTYLPSPVPETTLMPSLAEGDKNIFAVGLGLRKNAHALDLAYAYNLCADRKVEAPRNPIQGEYAFDAHLAAVTYTYAF